MIDGPVCEQRRGRFYTRLGCASCLVVALLNIVLIGASTAVMARSLLQSPAPRPAPIATVDVVNDTSNTVYVQPGTCSGSLGCNFGFGQGVPVQPGRSFPIPSFAVSTGTFVYRVNDASGKVIGCAKLGTSSENRINVSTLPGCP